MSPKEPQAELFASSKPAATPVAEDRERSLSLRQYVGHRKKAGLRGGSLSSVQAAIQEGKIHRQCQEHEYCPSECAQGGIPMLRADQEWADATVSTAANAPKGDGTLAGARAARELWKSRMARLEYEERIGALVRADQVRAEQFRMARTVRDKFLNLPRRLAGRLAAESKARVIQQLLEDEIETALAEVLNPTAPKPTRRKRATAPRARARV